ncbi:hypothetical protein QQF64_024009, partial [Cirrhinus molitorella]
SGDNGSDSCSLGTSAHGSFRSRSGADSIFGSSWFRDSSHTSYGSGAIKRHNSIDLPPPNRGRYTRATVSAQLHLEALTQLN